ncbi:MAG: DNA repair protein RecO [Peptococcaceae bacterium]
MEAYQHVNGLILRSRDYKEADQLLTVYTNEQGKCTVHAKGVKKTNSKLRSGILLFSQTELVLAESKGFPVVTGAEAVNMFSALRSDFVRMSYASYAAELLDQVVAEGQPDGQLFLLILQTFSLLEHIDAWLAVRYLELRLLEQQGYGVELEHCLYCGAPLTAERHRGVQGGLLCPACAAAEPPGLWLSREGMTVLRAFNQISLHRLGLVYVSKDGKKSIECYLDLQMQQLLSRPLKTRDFLRQMDL